MYGLSDIKVVVEAVRSRENDPIKSLRLSIIGVKS